MKNIDLLKEYVKYEKVLDKYELLKYIDVIKSEVDEAIEDAKDNSDLKYEIDCLQNEVYELEDEISELKDQIAEYKSILRRNT